MGTQANDGESYGLVSVMPTLSSRPSVLVYATGLESEDEKRKAMTCPLAICYDKTSPRLRLLENMLLMVPFTQVSSRVVNTYSCLASLHLPLPQQAGHLPGGSQKLVFFAFS